MVEKVCSGKARGNAGKFEKVGREHFFLLFCDPIGIETAPTDLSNPLLGECLPDFHVSYSSSGIQTRLQGYKD